MKKYCLLFLLPIILLILIITLIYLQNSNQIDMLDKDSDKIMYNFGSVNAGEIINHSFILKNAFRKKIIIEKVKKDCNCTIWDIKKKELDPGETTEITIELNSKGLSGPLRKGLYLTYSCLDKKYRTRLSLEGIIISDRRVIPDHIDYGFIDYEESISKGIKIQGFTNDFKILKVESPYFLKVECFSNKDSIAPLYDVFVTIKPDVENQEIFETIIFETNDNDKTFIHVPVRAHILPNIRVEPRSLILRHEKMKNSYQGIANIITKGQKINEIIIEEIKGPLDISISSSEEQSSIFIKLLENGKNKDIVKGSVRVLVKTNNGAQKLFLPVYCLTMSHP